LHQLLKHEHRACDRRIERRGQAGARTGSEQDPTVGPRAAKKAARKNSAARPNLYGWTLTAESESGTDRKDSTDELYRYQSVRRGRQLPA
jgi:hypothetical protein